MESTPWLGQGQGCKPGGVLGVCCRESDGWDTVPTRDSEEGKRKGRKEKKERKKDEGGKGEESGREAGKRRQREKGEGRREGGRGREGWAQG